MCMNLVGISEYDVTKLWNFEVILIACYSLALSLSLSISFCPVPLGFSPLPHPFTASPLFFPPSLSWTLTPPPVSSPPSFFPSTFANQSLLRLSLICLPFPLTCLLVPPLLWFLHSHSFFALISHLPPTTPGWDSGKYPTELDRTLPGGSKGRPRRRTEAIVLRSEKDHTEPLPAQLRFHCNAAVLHLLQLGGLGEAHEEKVESPGSLSCCQSACSYQ